MDEYKDKNKRISNKTVETFRQEDKSPHHYTIFEEKFTSRWDLKLRKFDEQTTSALSWLYCAERRKATLDRPDTCYIAY